MSAPEVPELPKPAPDLVVRELPDGVLVFDPARLRAHALNPSAAAILDRCDGTRDLAAMVADLRTELGSAAPPDLATQVGRAIDLLATEGVVVGWSGPGATTGVEPAPARGGRSFPNVPHTGEPAPPGRSATQVSAIHRGLDFVFRVTTNDGDLAAYLDGILDPLVVADLDGPDDLPVHTYEARTGVDPDGSELGATGPDPDPDAGLITLDGFVVSRGGRSRQVAAALLWHVNQMVSTSSDRLLQLHASAVVVDGRALVLPASMNSGKSTLVAGLASAGAAYVTDETVAIDPTTRLVIPYPKAIALDPGSWPLLPHLEPATDPAHERFEHQKWYVPPAATGAPTATPAPVGIIVFPTYRPHEPTELASLGPTDAAVELCQNAFNLDALGADGVDLIVALATTTPCYRLSTADLPSALATLHALIDGVDPDATALDDHVVSDAPS